MIDIVAADDGATVIVSQGLGVLAGVQGPQGPPAIMDAAFGFDVFSAGQVLNGIALAHPLIATSAASVAYSAAPPASGPQVVTLLRGGAPIGTATFSAGVRLGVIALTGGQVSFTAGDFLSFEAPSPLDAGFTHFAITYAGP